MIGEGLGNLGDSTKSLDEDTVSTVLAVGVKCGSVRFRIVFGAVFDRLEYIRFQ